MKHVKENALVVFGILALIVAVGIAIASSDKSNKAYEDRINELETELRVLKGGTE